MNEFWDEPERIFVWDCPFIEVSIVLNRPKLSVSLLDEEEPTYIW